MDKSLTKKIQNDFDRLALYDLEQWDHNNHYHQFLFKQMPTRCENILDLGCGVGEFSRLLASRADRVIAIDLSPKSIEIARQKSNQFNNIDYQVADATQYDFVREHFDAIVSIATVHHLSLEELLPKLKTSLKPGGCLLILDLLENHDFQGVLSDCIAVSLNWWFLARKNKSIQISKEAKDAMREHLRTDQYLNWSQVKKIYADFLAKPQIRKHLFWRYSVIWRKPFNR